MSMKNYNIKITEEDVLMIHFIRDQGCVNVSQFIRKCIKDKYEDIKNARIAATRNQADSPSGKRK